MTDKVDNTGVARTEMVDEQAPDTGRRNLALTFLGAMGGAALLKGCAPSSVVQDDEDTSAPVASITAALSGTASVKWCDTMTEQAQVKGGTSASSVNVCVRRGYASPADGGGGVFVWTADTTTAQSTDPQGGVLVVASSSVDNPRTGCWKRVYDGNINARWFGAKGDGVTDDTTAINASLDAAQLQQPPASVYLPAGTYIASNLYLRSHAVLAGDGAESTIIKRKVGASGSLISRHASATGAVKSCAIRDLQLKGQDGSGGVALELRSFAHGLFENLHIATFRNGAGTGVGVSLKNSADEGCYSNTFVSVTIGDCNTGLLMDSTTNVSACGYHRFFSLTVFQENDCVVLKNTSGNGSIYNLFSGILLQGTGAGGKGIYCEGAGNTFVNLIEDAVPGHNIELTATAASNVFIAPSLDLGKVINNNASGGLNTILGAGVMSGGVGQPFTFTDPLTGGSTLTVWASGPTNGPEIRLATDASALQWRLQVAHGGSAAHLTLAHASSEVERWKTDLSSVKYGDLTFSSPTKGVVIKDDATGQNYRLRITNGVLGLVAV